MLGNFPDSGDNDADVFPCGNVPTMPLMKTHGHFLTVFFSILSQNENLKCLHPKLANVNSHSFLHIIFVVFCCSNKVILFFALYLSLGLKWKQLLQNLMQISSSVGIIGALGSSLRNWFLELICPVILNLMSRSADYISTEEYIDCKFYAFNLQM